MKTFSLSMVLFVLTFSATGQIVTNEPARLKTRITCYEGKIGSGSSTGAVSFAPESTYPGSVWRDKLASPGNEHELECTFVGRSGNKDVYRFTFTRMTKAGSSDKTTTSKEVQFDGKQIIVFEDDLHAVVMESPNKEDLKSAKGH
jgi:hypothetical protein